MNASVEPSRDRVVFILSRINAGLTQKWSQISELATTLERMLKDARTLGEPHISAERREAWDKAWRDLRATFDAIRASDADAAEKLFVAGADCRSSDFSHADHLCPHVRANYARAVGIHSDRVAGKLFETLISTTDSKVRRRGAINS